MEQRFWKVGELAKETGLTVRALHHYDRKGLVTPSSATESGHRLYSEADIAKLQQVMSLKQMGFSLEEIKTLMEREGYDPREVLRVQMERLAETIEKQKQLFGRLDELYSMLGRRERVTGEQFLKIIEVMNMNPNDYFTDEQLDKLKKQSERLGPDKIREVENEWPGLIAKVREHMEKGTPAGDPEMSMLAKRWRELMNMFSGGDAAIVQAAERFHADNPGNPLQNGMDGELYRYIKEAMAKLN